MRHLGHHAFENPLLESPVASRRSPGRGALRGPIAEQRDQPYRRHAPAERLSPAASWQTLGKGFRSFWHCAPSPIGHQP